MDDISRDVLVIGAGISGLVCAYRLKQLGLDVALLERSDRVGGVIQSEHVDGFLIERGPNSSQGTEELLSLVEELGIETQLVEGDPKAPAYVYFRGRLHPVPAGPKACLQSQLLSISGKLRILREPFVSRRDSNSEESVADFVRRRIGREAAERLVAPFVSGIYAGNAERLSVQAAFPRLANLEANYGGLFRGMFAKAREARRAKKAASEVMSKATPTRRRLCSFRDGMSYLPATLASRIGEDLLTKCQNLEISAGKSGFEATFVAAENPTRLSASRLIIATPARSAARLTAALNPALSQLLNEIEYPPLAIVSLSYDTSRIGTKLDGFGFLAPPKEGLKILGCVWNSSLFPGRAPAGKALITAFVGGALNQAGTLVPDSELVSNTHEELSKVLQITGEPQVVAITRYELSIPQYNIGHFARVRRIEELLDATTGLNLIGNYLHGVSTGDCVKEADMVARRVAGVE